MSERKFLWGLYLSGTNGDYSVGTMTSVYIPEFDGEYQETFTSEDLVVLQQIMTENPEPKFNSNIFVAHNELGLYGQKIRELFKLKQNTLGNEKQTDPCAGQEKNNTMKEVQQKQPYGCGVYSVANALFIPSFITEERIEASKKGNAVYQLNKWLEEDNIPFRVDAYFFDMANTDPLRLLTAFDTTVEDNLVYCAILQVKKSEKSRWHMIAAQITNKGELVIHDSCSEHKISCSLHNILDHYYQVTGLFLFNGVHDSDTKAIVI